jgi:hypothetical protein
MFRAKKPKTAQNSISNLAFTQLLQDKMQNDIPTQTLVNKALNYDFRKFEKQKDMCIKQKKKLKIMDSILEDKKYNHQKIKSENDKFLRNFKLNEDLKRIHARKANTEGETFENRFKDLLKEYDNRGYNCEELITDSKNLFEPSPLLIETSAVYNYYKSNRPKKDEKLEDVGFLRKLEVIMKTGEGVINKSRKSLTVTTSPSRTKSQNKEFPKSLWQLEVEQNKLMRDIRLARETLNYISETEANANANNYIDTDDSRTPIRLTTNNSIKKSKLLFTPDQRQNTFKSFSNLSTKYTSTNKYNRNLRKSGASSSDMTSFTNFTSNLIESSVNTNKTKLIIDQSKDKKISNREKNFNRTHLPTRTTVKRKTLKIKENDIVRRLRNSIDLGLATTKTKRQYTDVSQRVTLTEVNEEVVNKKITQYLERQSYLEDVAEQIKGELPYDQRCLESIRNKIDFYNQEYIGYENRTVDNFFKKTLDANLLLRQVSSIKHKVDNLNIPLFYKSSLSHIKEEDEHKLKEIADLDKQLIKLNLDIAKRLNIC